MELKINRLYYKDTYTIGKLYIDDIYFCDTLEDKNRDLNKNGKFDNGEQKVYAETCIPFGTYDIKITYAPKFKRELPWLQNVPHFTGILIHRGTTAKNSAGCILVGRNTKVGMLTDSAKYEKMLVDSIKKAIDNHEKIIIKII